MPDRTNRSLADHPRIRGEHVWFWRFSGGIWWIIPAYAGSTNFDRLLYYDTEDHPRIRGEHFFVTFRDARLLGSSPHTRGALRLGAVLRQEGRIIPAYAGST